MNLPTKLILLSVIALLSFACQANQSIINSGKKNSTTAANSAERPKDTFESALRGVQKSDFTYIFVIRRKDGEQFTRDDKTYVRENSPPETNQFVLTDEDRVIIAGSNYPSLVESLEVWRKVFDVEDFSPKKTEEANTVSNNENNSNKTNTNSK